MSIHKKSLVFFFVLFLFLCCSSCAEKSPEPMPEQSITVSDQISGYNFYTAIVVNGTLYDGMAYYGHFPNDAVFVGQIVRITDKPQEELECNSEAEVGWDVYTFEFEENTFVGIVSPKAKYDDGSPKMMIVGMSGSQFERWRIATKS